MKKTSMAWRVVTLGLAGTLALSGMGGLAACSSASTTQESTSTTETTQSTDASTRTVTVDGTDNEIPAEVDKVAPTIGALAQITMMLSPTEGKVAATSTAQISDEFKTVLPAYEEGNGQGYDTSDVEQIIQSGAQVAYGPSSAYSDEQKQQLSDAGVVFIPMDNITTVDGICDTTLAIGTILGGDAETRAEEFVQYWKSNTEDAENRTANLTADEKPTVLALAYSNGSWTTETGQSMIASYIEAAGGTCLSKDYTAQEGSGGGRGKSGAVVDEEQIVSWNPDYIITYSTEATDALLSDAALADVTAIKEGHVYTSPKGLYLWSVRSGEGALMAPWIDTKINPALFSDVDMTKMVKDFFSTWYGYDLSDADAEAVLNGTY